MTEAADTTVHLVRHGQVENPGGVLYGRLAGYHLSELGRQMADKVADHFDGANVTHLRCSPLERARETMEPIAAHHPELDVVIDDRVIEAGNKFEGHIFGRRNLPLFNPRMFWHMRNPMRPSWGEPYREIADRMRAAMLDAAAAAGPGGQAVIVSHQLSIWMARRSLEGRSLFHDPRTRRCSLASVTSFVFRGTRVLRVEYAEPAAELLPVKTGRRFRVGT